MKNMLKRITARILYIAYRALDPFFKFEEISILTYHTISDAKLKIAITPAEFEKQLKSLVQKGYTFVALSQIVEWQKGGAALPRRAVAITFDDGYADFESNALPVLEKFKAPATMFVMSDTEASRPKIGNELPLLSRESIARLQAHPLLTFGFHGKTHANVAKIESAALREEMARPDDMRFFAYPGGSYSHEAMRVAEALGYEAAFSIKPGLVKKTSHRYLLPRNVIEKKMTLREVHLRVTRAFDWYSRLSRWFK